MSATNASNGFTLIELMVVVAIVAILAAIAYPAYTDSVDRSRRTDARVGLLQNAQLLERCYTRTNTYRDCAGLVTVSPEAFYAISNEVQANSFVLTATPTGVHTRDAKKCASFVLDHQGRRTATGSIGDDCW